MYRLFFGLNRQLAAASLNFDAPANADRARDAMLFQDRLKSPGAFMGGCLPRIFLCRVKRDHIDMAEQPVEQLSQLECNLRRVIDFPDKSPFKGDPAVSLLNINPAGF